MEAGGLDSEGREFKNAEEMWKEEIGNEKSNKKSLWYSQGVAYWQGVEATVDGVLGGYGDTNVADIKGSEAFLKELLSNRIPGGGKNQHLVALDCGAGIGRITKNLLIQYFNEVDLLEPVSHFLEAARESLSPENLLLKDSHTASNFYCLPLQEFTPEAERYDVIWVQWCIGHLTDDDFVSFFKRAKLRVLFTYIVRDKKCTVKTQYDQFLRTTSISLVGLKPGGFFVLKENIAKTGFVLDKEDRSITRSDSYFKELFNRCGLHLYKLKDQKGLPKELFAVKIYALTPDLPKKTRTRSQTNRPCIIK